MGFIIRTEEEKKRDNDIKLVNSVIYNINQLIPTESKYEIVDFVREYTDKVIEGFNSVFGDITTIVNIFSIMIYSNIWEIGEFVDHFNMLERVYPSIVDKNSKDYEKIKNIFINNFVGSNGILAKGIYNERVAALFEDRSLYLDCISIINGNDILSENVKMINKTIINLAPEYSTGVKLKNAVIQYLDGFEDIIDQDYEGYSEDVIERARNRNGISRITKKEMAIMHKKLVDASLILESIRTEGTLFNEKKGEVQAIIEEGIRVLKQEMENNKRIQDGILDIERQKIIRRIDDYVQALQDSLKAKSDEIFQQLTQFDKDQREELRRVFQNYSALAAEDLMNIQKASEEKYDTMRDFLANDPELHRVLAKAQEQTEKEEKRIIVPGSTAIIVPYTDIVLPKEIPTEILSLFDQSIPFEIRYEEMLKRKEANEKKGEIYHKEFLQAATALIEGDSLYLYGPSGSGKGYMVEQLANLFAFEKLIELSKITDKFTVEGYRDPQGIYRPSETFIAALYGYLLVQNELDNYDQNNVVMMNSIIDKINKKRLNQLEKVTHTFCNTVAISVHPNFHTIATANTRGDGPNIVYPQREQVDGSVLQRFTPIYIDYDCGLENQAITCKNWKEFIKVFREACADYAKEKRIEEAPGELTTRDIYKLQESIMHNRKKLDWIIEELFTQTKNPQYLQKLGEFVARKYKISFENIKSPSTYDNKKTALKDVATEEIAKTFIYQCRYPRGRNVL